MKIKIVCVGKLKEKYLKDGIEEYCKRISRFAKVEITELADEKIPDNPSPAQCDAVLKSEGEKIKKYLEGYIISLCIEGENVSSEKLAEKIRYDYAYLSRIFRKTVGISYNSYVNHYRLGHACYLLENTNYSITQCALESGYDSVRSFNRNFKSYLNTTPKNYRDNNR